MVFGETDYTSYHAVRFFITKDQQPLVTANKRIQATSGKFKIVGAPLYEEPNWVAVDKGDQEWNDTIKTIINDLHKDGTLKKISLKWIGSDITTQ